MNFFEMEHKFQFEKKIRELVEEILAKSNNRFDFREVIEGVTLKSSINDSLHKELEELKRIIQSGDGDKAILQINNMLGRTVLYIGSECEHLDTIGIEAEYTMLQQELSDSHIKLVKCKDPTIESMIQIWNEVLPEIVFFSCHGNEYGLYLKDENGKCQEYTNTKFSSFFETRVHYTDCIILSACESDNLGKDLSDYSKSIVCVNKKVDIKTATKFNQLFFRKVNRNSLWNSSIYKKAFDESEEIVKFQGRKDSWAFKFFENNNKK